MPKMLRWEKLEGEDIPAYMRKAIAVYKDTQTIFYLSNFDKSAHTAIEHVWKVTDKEGEVLKGMYTCGGFKLAFPPIKWASRVADNKRAAYNEEEDFDEENGQERDFTTPIVNDNDEDKFTAIVEAVKEEGLKVTEPEPPKKRGRGRPPGSKNKPKTDKPKQTKKKRKKRRKSW